MKDRNESSKQTQNQTLDMKTKSGLHTITVLSVAVLLSSNCFADAGAGAASPKSMPGKTRDVATRVTRPNEPRRIYDLQSRNFIDNPDDHELAPVAQAGRSVYTGPASGKAPTHNPAISRPTNPSFAAHRPV